MKYTLEIYYDKELKEFNKDFDLSIIKNTNIIHPSILNHKCWKIKSNKFISDKSTSDELYEFGNFIINNVEKYERKEFFYDLTRMTEIQIPDFFNFEMFKNVVLSKNYEFLINYLDMILILFEEKLKTDEALNIIMCMEFFELLSNFQQFTINYLKYPLYYNKELDHHLTQEHLDELRSFGYFNIKYGEMDYVGVWKAIE